MREGIGYIYRATSLGSTRNHQRPLYFPILFPNGLSSVFEKKVDHNIRLSKLYKTYSLDFSNSLKEYRFDLRYRWKTSIIKRIFLITL